VLVEGSTENATLARELLTGLRERGLEVTRPILVVLDGAKALRRAVLDVVDHPVLARCQQPKLRNVRDKLPQRLGGPVEHRSASPTTPPPRWTPKPSCWRSPVSSTRPPRAAASLREGLAETLTVLPLGVPPTLARSLGTTNTIESMISICREHASNITRWQDGQMALR